MESSQGKFKNIKYRKLEKSNDDDSFTHAQFESIPLKIPWRAVSLAFFLFLGGVSLLTAGCLILSGHIDGKYSDRTWPLITIGILMFLPGFYHVRIAYYAYKGYPGYSFDDIPEFE